MDGKSWTNCKFLQAYGNFIIMIIGSLLFVYFVITPSFILQTWVPKFSPLVGGLLGDSH